MIWKWLHKLIPDEVSVDKGLFLCSTGVKQEGIDKTMGFSWPPVDQ